MVQFSNQVCVFKVFKCHSIADMNEISIIKHVNGHSYNFILLNFNNIST